MALRADQWFMLGVVGLGVYAVYRIGRQSDNQTTRQPDGQRTEPRPVPIYPPTGPAARLSEQSGMIAAPPEGLVFATGPDPNRPQPVMRLSNSRAYRGRGEGLTEDDLARLGFDAIRIYETPEAARAEGAPEWSLTNAGQNTRWFYARYLGPTRDVSRPARVQTTWIVARPPERVAGQPTAYSRQPTASRNPAAYPPHMRYAYRW